MNTKHILTTITSQIPLLIMTINNGTGWHTLFVILLTPFIVCIIDLIPGLIKYLKKEKIPENYIQFSVKDDNGDDYPHINFMNDLSIFLNAFHPTSIKTGYVKNYYKLPFNPLLSFDCLKPIISPDESYCCKFMFLDKHNDKSIIDNIKKTGFIFPPDIDLKELVAHPLYLSFENKTEQLITNSKKESNVQSVNKQYVKVSAPSMKIAENFIYLVINYRKYKENCIKNFTLSKTMYFSDKSECGHIRSSVNVKKSYKNVFISRENSEKVIDTINEWNKNKITQLDKGIPNKLSFMFVGEPGCGKSSLIYAIANETKKHICSFNLQGFANRSFLATISGIENSVVVFDDIDAYSFTHKRTDETKKEKNDMASNLQLAFLKNSDETFSSSFMKEMTLDVLLEVLDGYNYLNNCIVILLSNHPELLDDAVIRPGRVDHIIKFSLTDKYQFKYMFKYFVGTDYEKIDKNFKFNEGKYSSSYLINTIILPNNKDPKKIIKLIKES